MKNKVLISVGPIPAKVDSVKYITNRFKGGLAIKTAKEIDCEELTIVKWVGTDIRNDDRTVNHFKAKNVEIVDVDDVLEYYKYVEDNKYKFDAFILAGAVANLMPVEPWKGKFPSHEYKEDDEFDIKFKIAPRIINIIKKNTSIKTLIGYKLFDGSDEELVKAGWEVLVESKSNVVFCNKPSTAKSEKIALMPDGSKIKMTFDEHVSFINRLLKVKYYKTEIDRSPLKGNRHEQPTFYERFCKIEEGSKEKIDEYLSKLSRSYGEYDFGTVAYFTDIENFKNDKSGITKYFMLTTTRGKRDITITRDIYFNGTNNWDKQSSTNHFAKVYNVEDNTVTADKKATMNAPFLWDLKKKFPETKVILHGHMLPDDIEQIFEYAIPGTNEESDLIPKINSKKIYIKHHGYYYLFDSVWEADKWLFSKEYKNVDHLISQGNTEFVV